MRPLRAWMLALPIDFVAAAAPALWFEEIGVDCVDGGTHRCDLLASVVSIVGRRHLVFSTSYQPRRSAC